MFTKKSEYEALLAQYSDHQAVIELLKQFRPYLEMVPSMRRPGESVISIPLPLIIRRIEEYQSGQLVQSRSEVMELPCDIGVLMCDPEWKIKTGVEICIFICRPNEDFSDLLRRWRRTQMIVNDGYEWVMPRRYNHIMSDAADEVLPLFIGGVNTPERLVRGLRAAALPYVQQQPKDDLILAHEREISMGADDLPESSDGDLVIESSPDATAS